MITELTYIHTRNLFIRNEFKSFVNRYFKDVKFKGCSSGNWDPIIEISNWDEIKDILPKSYTPAKIENKKDIIMKQFTEEQAIAFNDSREWEQWSDEQIVRLQLFQDKICMEWNRFHQALEKVLGRAVYTHEFTNKNIDNLKEEYLGTKQAPTFQEIVNLIPEEKRIVIGI